MVLVQGARVRISGSGDNFNRIAFFSKSILCCESVLLSRGRPKGKDWTLLPKTKQEQNQQCLKKKSQTPAAPPFDLSHQTTKLLTAYIAPTPTKSPKATNHLTKAPSHFADEYKYRVNVLCGSTSVVGATVSVVPFRV